jgi:hypothetical protein
MPLRQTGPACRSICTGSNSVRFYSRSRSFGLFFASFRAWRELDREIGLRAHIRSINYTNDGGYETKVFVAVNITNSGVIPSVATDWTLVFGKRSVRSYERKFRTDTNVDFDPQMTPIGLGNRAYGTLVFKTSWSPKELDRKRNKLRLMFRDAARRNLRAFLDEAS